MSIKVTSILDMLENGDEDAVKDYLENFSCERIVDGEKVSLNPDVEHFVKNTAIEFAKQRISISYIVSDTEDGAFLGFFTITHKPIDIPATGLNSKIKRRMRRFADYDEELGIYTPSAFLLAQFGKNYAIDDGKRISGKELMKYANDVFLNVQNIAGGGVAYLDCEAHAELINFYEGEGFRLFGERISKKDGKHYLQYMKFVGDSAPKA